MAKKRVVPSDEQQMVMADIQANPRILFTKEYSHWRDYLRRTSPNYVDRLYENLPYEQQLDIYNNDREAWGALSNNVKGNFGGSQVRKKTDEVSPYVAGVLGLIGAAPAMEAVAMFPMLESGLNTYFGYEGIKNLPAAATNAYDYAKKGDWSRAGLSAGEAVLDGMLIGNGIKGVKSLSELSGLSDRVYNAFPILDPYTTPGATFGYHGTSALDRLLGTISRRNGLTYKPEIPEFHRRLRIGAPGGMKFNENGDFVLSSGRTGDGHDGIVNFATSEPARGHRSHKALSGIDDYIINPKALKDQKFISIEPSDTFFETGELAVNPKDVTLVSGNTKLLDYAKSKGFNTLSSPRLREYYRKNYAEPTVSDEGSSKFSITKYGEDVSPRDVGDEIQRLTSRRGAPTLADYKFFENETGLPSGVVPIKEYNSVGQKALYGHSSSLRANLNWNNVAYDPATQSEALYRAAKLHPENEEAVKKYSDYMDNLKKVSFGQNAKTQNSNESHPYKNYNFLGNALTDVRNAFYDVLVDPFLQKVGEFRGYPKTPSLSDKRFYTEKSIPEDVRQNFVNNVRERYYRSRVGGAVFGGIAALSNYTGRRSQIIDDALKAGIDIRMKRGEETADEYYDRLERELIQMGFYGQEALEEYNQNNNTKAMGGNISLAPNLMAFGGNMYWGGGPFSTINTNTPGVGLNSSSSKLNYNFNANSNPYAKYGLNSDFTKMTAEQSFKNRTGVDSSILGGGLNSGAASGGSKFAGAMSNMDTYLSGAMTIAGSAINNWNTNEKNDIIKSQNKADINNYVNSINNTNNAFGSRSTEGLISQYNAQANNVLNPSKAAIKWQDLRPSKGKQWANVGSAVGAGASIGTAIMPGWGTVIGAAAGGLIAGVGSIFGRRKAKREEARRNEEIRRANALNIYNADVNASQLAGAFNNATNNQNLENNLYSMANYSAFGGGINISPNMISMANNYMDNNRLATLNKAASLGLDNSFLMPKVKSFAIGGPVNPPKEDEVQPASTTAAYPAIGLDSTLIRNAQEQALLDKSLRTIDKMTYDEVREKANQMIDAYSDPSRFSHTDMTEYLGKNEYAMGGTPNVVSPFNGYSSDMMEVNAGGTHEQNPYGGVRIGVDNRGIPNLVEEGEVIWKSTGNKLIGKNIYDNGGSMNNAFVFTNRVIPHLADLMDVGIAKKRPVSDKEEKKNQKNGKTYADHAKEIHKPLEERPNDSVTQNTVNAQLSRLRDLQNADNAERQAAMEEQAARRGMALGTESMMGNGMMPSEGLAQASRNQMMQDESIQRAASEGLALSDYNRSGGAMLHAFGGNMFKYGTPNPTDPYEDAMASAVPGYKYLLSGQAQSPEEAAKMAYYDNAFSGLTETGKWQSTETPVVGKTPPAPSLSVVNNTSTPTVNLAQTPRTTKDTSDDWYFKGRPTFMRYAPVLGSVLATVADSTGYFSPDYSLVNQLAAEGSKGSYIPVEPAHIGDYLDYRPFDVNYATNKLNAQTAANARGLVNTSNGMRGNVQSALLANQYNAGIGLGELQKAAFEYNLNDRDKVGNFNKDTNKFNATADLEAQKANQAALASLAQYKLNGLGEAAKLRYQMDMDDISRKYADFTSLFNNLGEVGRDNLNYNMAMSNPAYYYGADGRGIIGYKGKMTKDDKYGWRKRKAKKRVDPSETMGYLIG